MAEAEVQEVSTPESADNSPPDSENTVVYHDMDTTPTEAETPAEQAEPSPEPSEPEPAAPRTPQEIIAAHNNGELLTDEERRIGAEYQRAEANRAYARQQAADLQRSKLQEIQKTIQETPAELIRAMKEESDAATLDGREISTDVLMAKVGPKVNAFAQALKPALFISETADMRLKLAREIQAVGADPTPLYQWLEESQADFGTTAEAAFKWGMSIGQATSDSASELAKVKADLASTKAENTRLIAERGKAPPTTASSSAEPRNTTLNVETATNMPIEELMKLRAAQRA